MKMKRVLFLFTLTIVLSACSSNQESSERRADGCILPPEEFSEKDLVGTWVAGLSWRKDTLIIQEDGIYKQAIHIERYTEDSSFDYESDWQPWRLEYSESGLPYLHMEGMRLCAYAGGYIDCEVVGGGDSPEAKWYDFCKKEWIQMPGEGVLIVMGSPQGFVQPPRGLDLVLLQRGEDIWSYGLKEPSVPTLTATSPP